MWRRIRVWRRRRVWKKRSRTDLLRNPSFQHVWAEAATDRFLLEQVERYGKALWARLKAVVDERRFVYGLRDGVDWDGGESDLENWALNLNELVEGGLVVVTDEGAAQEFALTHAGRSQLHSLRSAAQNSRRLRVAAKSLKVAVVALVVGVILQLIGVLYQTGVFGNS